MFRISKLSDYGMVVMTHFTNTQGELHTARDIAEKTHLALPTVTKILKILTRNALLISQRGAAGGYELARSPEDISVAEVIKAIEGDLGLTECSQHDSHCVLESTCKTRRNWQLISEVILSALSVVSVADMTHSIDTAFFIEKLKHLESSHHE